MSAVVIGKSKKPRETGKEFWRRHEMQYFSNSSGLMTCEIFYELVKEFDEHSTSPTILLLDNFSGHDTTSMVESRPFRFIIPIFLPPRITASTQPLDAGIISVVKARYRAQLLNFVRDQVQEGTFNINRSGSQLQFHGFRMP